MKKIIIFFLVISLAVTAPVLAASKGNSKQRYVTAQETLKILQQMGIGQGNELSFVKTSATGDKEWQTHLFSVQQGDASMPLVTYVNSRDVVVGILIRDGKLVVPKMPIEEIQPRIDIKNSKLSQERRPTFNVNAKEVIYMFTDPDSSYCQSIESALPKYSGKYKVIVKHFPIEQLHPGAKERSVDKQCATLAQPCDSQTRQLAAQIVDEDIQEGAAIGVDGVPFFITQRGAIMHRIPDMDKSSKK